MAEGPSGHNGLAGQSSADRSWATRAIPVRPQVLDRIQFRGIARKKLHPQPPALLADELPRGAAAMALQTVPDDQQLAGNMAQQMGEELKQWMFFPLRL